MMEFIKNLFFQICVCGLGFWMGCLYMRESYLSIIRELRKKIDFLEHGK